MKIIFLLLIFFYIPVCITEADAQFIKGADVSFIPQLEENGAVYLDNGIPKDPVEIFKQNGINYIRLRLWHTPASGYNNLPKTVLMAQRIKSKGLKFLLDFHYSDTWADPSNQTKPQAWKSLSFQNLTDSLYLYTVNVIKAFNSAGALPDMVQIGNEVFGGFLWPDGEVDGSTQHWVQFTSLLTAASNAVNDSLQGPKIPVMIHIEKGGYFNDCKYFFDKVITTYHVPFDVIGLSLYPWWHGSLNDLRININSLAQIYNKDIVVVETAYPWTLDSLNDNVENFVQDTLQLQAGYPASPAGQYNFLKDLMQVVDSVPDGKGLGIFYWAPEYISLPSIGSSWENLTFFDFRGNALKSMRVFKEPGIPSVDSIYIEILNEKSVRLLADIDSGNDPCVVKFQWDSDTIGIWVKDSAAANSPLIFGTASYTLNNLSQNSDYYFRAYISSSYGADTSDIRLFRTNPLINIKVFLQGPFSSVAHRMSTNINTILPHNSPYPEAPKSVSTIPDSITDWILLQLRETSSGSTVLSKSCFLSRNGSLIDPDGLRSNLSLNINPGSYYAVIRHRNHLAVMSSSRLQLNGITNYNFTTGSGRFFGTGGAVQLETGVWGIWAGDVIQNGLIKYNGSENDRLPILVRVGNIQSATLNGYYIEDTNMDGQVKYNGSDNDRVIILNNLNNIQSSSKSTQVP